jgi:hypothetical protein
MDLAGYCRSFGQNYYAQNTSDHAYGWECTDNLNTFGIDTGAVCRSQWGSNYKAVLKGNYKYDWSCTGWSDANHKVVPVVIVSSEYFYNVDEVNAGIQAYAARMLKTRSWYSNHMYSGKTFSLVKPVVHLSLKNNSVWRNLSCLTADPSDRPAECPDHKAPADRGKLFYAMVNEVKYLFNNKKTKTDIIAPIFIYTGTDSEPFWLGAASLTVDDVKYDALPPNIGACSVNDEYCGVYAIGHEMGHSMGLGHTCDLDTVPTGICGYSIMENPSNNFEQAILFPEEQEVLERSPFMSHIFID